MRKPRVVVIRGALSGPARAEPAGRGVGKLEISSLSLSLRIRQAGPPTVYAYRALARGTPGGLSKAAPGLSLSLTRPGDLPGGLVPALVRPGGDEFKSN